MDDVETCQDLNLRMQSILVKQHVLEALNTHEQKKDGSSGSEQSEDEEESQGEEESEEEDFDRQPDVKQSEILQFENEGDDMDFGGSNGSEDGGHSKVVNDEDLLLDNFYKKAG